MDFFSVNRDKNTKTKTPQTTTTTRTITKPMKFPGKPAIPRAHKGHRTPCGETSHAHAVRDRRKTLHNEPSRVRTEKKPHSCASHVVAPEVFLRCFFISMQKKGLCLPPPPYPTRLNSCVLPAATGVLQRDIRALLVEPRL